MMSASHPTPQYLRILVPADGSDGARHAAEAATELAHISGGRVIALHVLPPDTTDAEYLGMSGMAGVAPLDSALTEPAPRGADSALAAIESVARDRGVLFESEQVVDATPARAIAETAEHMRCDLIVMSSHGYGSALSFLTGSTNAKMVSACAVPMLVVH
jgi:nucleotide-binding universal stress UspA family protein